MSSPVDSRQKAIALIEQLSQDKLPAVVQLLELLAAPADQSTVSEEENKLLRIIQQQLPEKMQERLDDLRDRCEWSELTEAEHQELIRYEDQQEQYRVDRLGALIALANIRDIDIISLNREIQSASRHSDAA